MQNDFFNKYPGLRKQRDTLINQVNDLISIGRDYEIPLFWIIQEFKPDLSDAFPLMKKNKSYITIKDTPGSKILDELDSRKQDVRITKQRYSAFFETKLKELLEQRNCTQIILAGINTHACVRMTAIDAYQHDYDVIIAKDCIFSWDRDHHEITLRYLGKSMGIEILTNQQVRNKILNKINQPFEYI